MGIFNSGIMLRIFNVLHKIKLKKSKSHTIKMTIAAAPDFPEKCCISTVLFNISMFSNFSKTLNLPAFEIYCN